MNKNDSIKLMNNALHQIDFCDGNQMSAWIILDAMSAAFDGINIESKIYNSINKYGDTIDNNETKQWALNTLNSVMPLLDSADRDDLLFRVVTTTPHS